MKPETKEIVEALQLIIASASVALGQKDKPSIIINVIVIEHGGNWNFGKKEGEK